MIKSSTTAHTQKRKKTAEDVTRVSKKKLFFINLIICMLIHYHNVFINKSSHELKDPGELGKVGTVI